MNADFADFKEVPPPRSVPPLGKRQPGKLPKTPFFRQFRYRSASGRCDYFRIAHDPTTTYGGDRSTARLGEVVPKQNDILSARDKERRFNEITHWKSDFRGVDDPCGVDI